MSVHYIHPERLSRAMRDHDAAAHRNAIDAAEYVRARIVDEPRKRDFRYIVLGALAALCWVAIFVIARAW